VGRNIPNMTKRTSRVHSVTQLKLLSTCATAGGGSAKLQTQGYLFLQGCGGGEKAVAVTGGGVSPPKTRRYSDFSLTEYIYTFSYNY